MSGWGIAAAVVAAIFLILWFLPIRLRLSFQGRADPSGTWALAGGAQVGPAMASGVAARGIATTVQAHLFGRSIYKRTLRELLDERERKKLEAEAEDEVAAAKAQIERGLDRARARYRKLERWFDPVDLALFVIRERRRIVIEELVVDLDYSFVDITLTGKLLGAIYAFSALLPDPIVIRQTPSWESADRIAIAGSGKIRIWPGLLVVDAAWFLVRNVRVRKRLPATEPL